MRIKCCKITVHTKLLQWNQNKNIKIKMTGIIWVAYPRAKTTTFPLTLHLGVPRISIGSVGGEQLKNLCSLSPISPLDPEVHHEQIFTDKQNLVQFLRLHRASMLVQDESSVAEQSFNIGRSRRRSEEPPHNTKQRLLHLASICRHFVSGPKTAK